MLMKLESEYGTEGASRTVGSRLSSVTKLISKPMEESETPESFIMRQNSVFSDELGGKLSGDEILHAATITGCLPRYTSVLTPLLTAPTTTMPQIQLAMESCDSIQGSTKQESDVAALMSKKNNKQLAALKAEVKTLKKKQSNNNTHVRKPGQKSKYDGPDCSHCKKLGRRSLRHSEKTCFLKHPENAPSWWTKPTAHGKLAHVKTNTDLDVVALNSNVSPAPPASPPAQDTVAKEKVIAEVNFMEDGTENVVMSLNDTDEE